MNRILNTAAITMLGVMAGFFFAWTNPAMMGFENTSADVYVAAMQAINREVRNASFGIFFFGSIPVLALAFWRSGWRVLPGAALALYLAAFFTTMLINVPMNEAMDAWTPATQPAEAEIWEFHATWTLANTARTLMCILGVALLSWDVTRSD